MPALPSPGSRRTRSSNKPYNRPAPGGPDESSETLVSFSRAYDLDDAPRASGSTRSSNDSSIEYDDEFSEGDFHVVSSDDVHFRVPSFYLYSASPVFRYANELAADSPKTMEFTDPQFETAAVLRLFLQIASGRRLTLERSLKTEQQLALFLRKWECEGLLANLLMHIREEFRAGSVSTFEVWAIGARVQDIDTCVAALQKYYKTVSVAALHANKPEHSKLGSSVWDPSAWGLSRWELSLPPKYLWALSRAFGDVGAKKDLADTFKKYIEGCTR